MGTVHRIKQRLDELGWEKGKEDFKAIIEQVKSEFPDATEMEFTIAFVAWVNENRDDEGYTVIGYTKE